MPSPAPAGFLDLRRAPDTVIVQTDAGEARLSPANGDRWTGEGVSVGTIVRNDALRVQVSSAATPIKRIHLRWRDDMSAARLILGDAWERGYGDLEWRAWIPDRVMPWYVATFDGTATHAYGVRTGCERVLLLASGSARGVSLWADVRSGGVRRSSSASARSTCATSFVAQDVTASRAFAAIHAFCRVMCPSPRLPRQPLYGSNDWYWAYGKNSAGTVLADAQHIVELSPTGENRPFAVIDDGWQPVRGTDKTGVGTWDRGNEKFPDMPGLAASVRRAGARPGIWIRPLQAPADAPDAWRLPRDRMFLDPTVAEARQKIRDDIARLASVGLRADQARLHDVRHLRPLGISDGRRR